jgi:hypothetical protein
MVAGLIRPKSRDWQRDGIEAKVASCFDDIGTELNYGYLEAIVLFLVAPVISDDKVRPNSVR